MGGVTPSRAVSPPSSSGAAGARRVGRPRQYAEDVERGLIVEAGYAALREHQGEMTLAHVLQEAGVSTRSFYRHFESKDALLCALYRRDAEYAARRVETRLQRAGSPIAAVEAWIDEIYGFVRSARRAERVSVLGSIPALRAEGIDHEVAHGRELLVAPLRAAIERGIGTGAFAHADAHAVADLLAVAILHGSGVQRVSSGHAVDQRETERWSRRALGVES